MKRTAACSISTKSICSPIADRRAARRRIERPPHVERDGFSASAEARFVLLGSMNPEEGLLRPQLLDRFALSLDVEAPGGREDRALIVELSVAIRRGSGRILRLVRRRATTAASGR